MPGAFPDASTTGVPAGTTLTQYTGPFTISTAGTVIDGKTITSCIGINATDVTIRNSRITADCGYVVYAQDKGSASPSLTLEDTEIQCTGLHNTAVGEANITMRRVKIHGCENGGDVNRDWDVRDSYVYDVDNRDGAHADGFQMGAGHFEGSTLVAGVKNITFVHNTIFSVDSSGNGGTSAIISNRLTGGNPAGPDQNMLIQGNLMGGGAFTLYCEQDGAHYVNGQVTGNAFTTRFYPKGGAFGFSTDCGDETQSGNYVYETGQPLALP